MSNAKPISLILNFKDGSARSYRELNFMLVSLLFAHSAGLAQAKPKRTEMHDKVIYQLEGE